MGDIKKSFIDYFVKLHEDKNYENPEKVAEETFNKLIVPMIVKEKERKKKNEI